MKKEIVTVVLVVLVIIALVQAVQINTIKGKLSASAEPKAAVTGEAVAQVVPDALPTDTVPIGEA